VINTRSFSSDRTLIERTQEDQTCGRSQYGRCNPEHHNLLHRRFNTPRHHAEKHMGRVNLSPQAG
jgi:hypothetical protein